METAFAVAPEIGLAPACRALGLSRATAYRHRRPKPSSSRPRRPPPRALSDEERAQVLGQLHSERFVDASPAAVYATLLDEGTYLASERTMYRLLAASAEVRERRAQLRHPAYDKPELLATGPNELWSWDITKLKGPAKWTWFYLYVILDVFSRYVPGWMVASRESAVLAERLIADSVAKQGITAGTLTRPRRPRQLDALQAGRAPARRSRHRQEPRPAPHSIGGVVLSGQLGFATPQAATGLELSVIARARRRSRLPSSRTWTCSPRGSAWIRWSSGS